MKNTFLILLVFLLSTCLPKKELCENEKNILAYKEASQDIKFDFTISEKEQISNIEKQIGLDLCDNPEVLNLNLELNKHFSPNILFVINKECNNRTIDLPGIPIETVQILANKSSAVLVEDVSCEVSEVKNRIKQIVINHGIKKIQYSVNTDSETKVDVRKKIYESIILGHISAVKYHSEIEFNKNLCKLDSTEFRKLEKELQIVFLLGYRPIPAPPPPSLKE